MRKKGAGDDGMALLCVCVCARVEEMCVWWI